MTMPTKLILRVVMIDTSRTSEALVHENHFIPPSRRTVDIELTPDQVAKLAPRMVGGIDEDRGEVWLEDVEETVADHYMTEAEARAVARKHCVEGPAVDRFDADLRILGVIRD